MSASDTTYDIGAVTWNDEGIAIQYMASTDVRVGGHVMAQHILSLHGAHDDYREDIDNLQHRVQKILKNALEDFEESQPYHGEDEPEDDDELGMGMGE